MDKRDYINQIASSITIFIFITGIISLPAIIQRISMPPSSLGNQPTTTQGDQLTTTQRNQPTTTQANQPTSPLKNQSNTAHEIIKTTPSDEPIGRQASGFYGGPSVNQDGGQNPQQNITPASVGSGDLSGRWNGIWGSDNKREVLKLTENSPGVFSGTSCFEARGTGELSYGRGAVNGTISGSRVSITISRDNMVFHWSGTVDSSYHTLIGTFAGYSNDGTYIKE
ncbi:MAG: hypothetical protein KGZ93_10900 [Actinobacteria bacterium]|nr:hypothetical protein [Actinomycetota bacterium]